LAQLERDNSGDPAIKAQKRKLAEEIAALQQGVEDKQRSQYVAEQERAYDDDYKAFKEGKDKEIDKIRAYLSKSGLLTQDAMRRIEKGGAGMYGALIEWNSVYGSGIDDDVTKAWEAAYRALEQYKTLLGTISVSGAAAALNGSARSDTVSQMKRNAALWNGGTPEQQQALHDENERLGASIGAVYDSASGRWYAENGAPLYHDGGRVGGAGVAVSSAQEEFAKVLKGEWVSNPAQQARFMDAVLPSMLASAAARNRENNNIIYDGKVDIVIEGNADRSTLAALQKCAEAISGRAAKKILDAFKGRGLKASPSSFLRVAGG
jgi:hypothetical protein